MENSQVGTLRPTQKPFEFPPHRRRPLRSKTFSTLVQIVSHCNTQSHVLEAILEEPKLGNKDSSVCAFGQATGGDKLSESLSIGNGLVIQNEEITGPQDEGDNGSLHMEVDRLGNRDSIKRSDDDRLKDNQEDQITLPEFDFEELVPLAEVLIAGSSKSSDDRAKASQHIEINESEVQSKEKELEKLISASDIPLVIEDGEISHLMDFLLEEDPKSEGKSAGNGQISHAIIDKKVSSIDELQKRIEKDVALARLPENMEHRKQINYEFLESGKTAPTRSFEDNADKKIKKPRRGPQPEAKKENNMLFDNADKKTKKPRRRTQTEAKKENNTRKERTSRAEKNKKQGVKRLRLDPIPPKPRQKPECRHFKMGRCHLENCNYSHDVIPTTKYTACCHHARGSCLKGDECPYDHDLSKYACSNFITNGFCNRGPSCMFKHDHEVPVKEGGPTASNMPKPEQKSIPSSSLPSNVFPKKQYNGQDPSIRYPNIKSTSTSVSPYKNTQQNSQTPISKPSLPVPKGMTFLSNNHIPRSSDPTTDKASEPEVPKTTPAPAPRGINFLSFGKGVGKSPLSDSVECKTPPVQPTQGIKAPAEDCLTNTNKQANSISKEDKVSDNKQSTSTSSSFSERVQLLSGTPSSVHKALQSTFAFAAKMDKSVGSSQNQSTNKVSTILDFLYGDRNQKKQS